MDIKKQFPIFKNYPFTWGYLDSAATTQKPKVVIDAVRRFYEAGNSNVHRGDYLLARKATEAYEGVRQKVADFIRAKSSEEIMFTKNTNEAFNVIVKNCESFLCEKSVVVLSRLEHNANVVPWLELQRKLKFKIHWLDFDEEYNLKYEVPAEVLENVRIVSLTHVSNVTGTLVPLKKIFEYFRKNNKRYVICIGDGAQAVGHLPVNMQELACDYYAFSAHKMYAPSGVGILYAKKDSQFPLEPVLFGSHMVKDVGENFYDLAEFPDRMEVGTGNLEGVFGLGAAIDFLKELGMGFVHLKEQELIAYAVERFKELKCYVRGSSQSFNRTGVFSFDYDSIHPHDVAQALDTANICVRSGNHCAHIVMKALDISGTTRASFGIYTTKKDIDNLVDTLKEVEAFYKV